MREELIFAYRRSGFIVGERSREMMPDSDLQEWESAMDEYFELKELGYDPFHVFTYLSGADYEIYKDAISVLDDVIIAIGLSTFRPKSLRNSVEYLRFLLIKRTIRSLRIIRKMFASHYDDDCLAIVRTIYEAYLRMKLLRLQPISAERFEAAIAHEAGVFYTKTRKNGRPDYSSCVDPSTGREFRIIISNQETIRISDFPLEDEIYSEIYPMLSGYVHPDLVKDALQSLKAGKIVLTSAGDPVKSIILTSAICLLLLREVAESSFLKTVRKRDVRFISKKILKNTRKLISCDSVLVGLNVPISLHKLFDLKIEASKL